MKIAEGLYRARVTREEREMLEKVISALDEVREITGTEIMIRTEGQQWYTDQVEQGRREIQQQARRHGWGLCGRFPVEALEAE